MIAVLLFSQVGSAYVFRTDVDDTWPQATDEFFSYIHSDILGSSSLYTEGLAKATHGGLRYVRGEAVQVVEYKPFGVERYVLNPLIEAGPRYTGQVFDLDTDLYYYNARYYDASLGRFIQPDSIIQDTYSPQLLNPYSYVANNPLKYVDPTGNFIDTPLSLHDLNEEMTLEQTVDLSGPHSGLIEDAFIEGSVQLYDTVTYASAATLEWALSPLVIVDKAVEEITGGCDAACQIGGLASAGGPGLVVAAARMGLLGLEELAANKVLTSLGRFGKGAKSVGSELAQSPWPVNSGFIDGTIERKFIMPGESFDRYGFGGGKFVSPSATPIEMRSLRSGAESLPYNNYRVLKLIEVNSGGVMPAFGQPGLGTQHELPVSIDVLLKHGFIEKVK